MLAVIDPDMIAIVGLFIALFSALIGCYIFIFSCSSKIMTVMSEEISKVYVLINSHIQNAQMHADIDKMVSNKVCEEARKSNNEAIKGIRADLDKQHDVLVNVDKNMATLTERVTNFMDQFNR